MVAARSRSSSAVCSSSSSSAPVAAAQHLGEHDAVVHGEDGAGELGGRDGEGEPGPGRDGLDQRGEPAVHRRDVLEQGGGGLGVACGVQAVLGEHEHPGALGAERGQAARDAGGHRVGLLLDAGQLLLGEGEVARGLPGEQGGEQLVLGAEAGVEGAAGEAAAAADVLDAGGGEPDLGEGLQCGVEQPLDRLRAPPLGPRLDLVHTHDARMYRIHPVYRNWPEPRCERLSQPPRAAETTACASSCTRARCSGPRNDSA